MIYEVLRHKTHTYFILNLFFTRSYPFHSIREKKMYLAVSLFFLIEC
jgi:hypothetical protein